MSAAALLSQIGDATHTWFWLFGALFIVGLFLALGGVLRTALSVIDRASRLIAATGGLLLVGGLAGAMVVAAGAPGSMTAVMKDMMGMGGAVTAAPAPPPKRGAPEVSVTGVDFKFQPNILDVPAGKTVDVIFDNAGQSPHTFTVVGKGFEVKADPGQSTSGALPPLKPGRYQFICSIPGHAQLGMTGTLVVGKG